MLFADGRQIVNKLLIVQLAQEKKKILMKDFKDIWQMSTPSQESVRAKQIRAPKLNKKN